MTLLGRHERLTRGHTERVRAYSDLIAEELGISAEDRQRLAWAALLHDIGKLTVPSYILNSDGRPSDEEWQILRGHPAAGEAFVEPLADWLGEWKGATSEHHERWDGGGYPRGLQSNEISLSGRIVAAADAYDVITSKRSYKAAMSPEAARSELVRCSGTQFDPDVVRALLKVSLEERRPRSVVAWLVELFQLDRVAQAVAVAPTAAVVGIASLGSLVGLTDAAASEAPEQLAFVAVDPSTAADSTQVATADDLAVDLAEDSSDDGAPTTSAPSTGDEPVPNLPASDSPTGGSESTPSTESSPNTGIRTTLPPLSIPGITVPPPTTATTISLSVTTTMATLPSTTSTTSTTTTSTTTTTTTPPIGPTARDDVHSTVLGLISSIPVLGNDSAGSSPLDSGTLRIVSSPGSGNAWVSGGTIHFETPGLIFLGTTLSYEICDANSLCDQATVTIVL